MTNKTLHTNVCKITVHIGAEPRVNSAGTVGEVRAFVSMGKKDEKYLPSLWLTIKGFGKQTAAVGALKKGELVTVSGRLMYEEFEITKGAAKGSKGTSVSIIASKLEPFADKFVNWIKLAVTLARDGDARMTDAGRLWAKARARVSMGKDKATDKWLPSWFVTVKAFTTQDGDQAVPEALGALIKGSQAVVTGKLAYEEYDKTAGGKGQDYQLIATQIEAIESEVEGAAAEAEAAPNEPD
jgi:single-stranded DNA-binding protein